MSKLPYTFNKIIDEEQVELIIGKYHQQRFDCRGELEVYAAICEILYENGFRAFLDSMYNLETNSYFDWDVLMKYETVVDFQIQWHCA